MNHCTNCLKSTGSSRHWNSRICCSLSLFPCSYVMCHLFFFFFFFSSLDFKNCSSLSLFSCSLQVAPTTLTKITQQTTNHPSQSFFSVTFFTAPVTTPPTLSVNLNCSFKSITLSTLSSTKSPTVFNTVPAPPTKSY